MMISTRACWLGMQNGTSTMENSVELPQEIKNKTTTIFKNPISGYSFRRVEIRILKTYPTSMFIKALFTIVEITKPRMSP